MHIGLGHDLGSVIEGTAKGSISIIRANGGGYKPCPKWCKTEKYWKP